jgi:hypothetical protein
VGCDAPAAREVQASDAAHRSPLRHVANQRPKSRMREIRTSGSVGAPPGDRRGYPTGPSPEAPRARAFGTQTAVSSPARQSRASRRRASSPAWPPEGHCVAPKTVMPRSNAVPPGPFQVTPGVWSVPCALPG